MDEAGYAYEVMPADIDEKVIRSEDLHQLPLLVARAKTKALLPRITEPAFLITADSIAVWHGQLREKPTSVDEARKFIRSYSHDAVGNITGVVVTNTITGKQAEGVESATTFFDELPDAAVEALLEDGFIMNCAGAYAIEHPLMKPYVARNEGEASCVIGLPLGLTRKLLHQVGYAAA